jgi:hypothetical protein
MEYVLAVSLTLIGTWSIIILSRNKLSKSLKNIAYRQSDIHERIKDFIPEIVNNKKTIESQSQKHAASTMIKIIVIDDKAYWVKDNIFYYAKTHNGDIVSETTEPVDVSLMSKDDIEKMLFILDNLRKGKEYDSGGTGF